jgi:hypothetical protein
MRCSLPRIDGAARAGFVHDDAGELRQRRFQIAPDPAREVFAGRILEARHVVEETVVELLEERLERTLEVREIHDPPEVRIDWTPDVHLDAERMTVHARALVSGGDVRQSVRALERERLEDLHG